MVAAGEGEVGLSSEEVEVIVVALGLLGLRVPSELQEVRVCGGSGPSHLCKFSRSVLKSKVSPNVTLHRFLTSHTATYAGIYQGGVPKAR